MLVYIDAEVNLDSIKIFSDSIDNNIELFEESVAFTWLIFGYNYITEKELTTTEIDLMAKFALDLGYDEEALKDIDNTYTVFKMWYHFTLNDNEQYYIEQ